MAKLQRGKEILKNLADIHTGREAKDYMNEARRTKKLGHGAVQEFKSTFYDRAESLRNKARRSQRTSKNLRRSEVVAGGTAAAGAGGYAVHRHRKGQSNEST